MKKVFDKVTVVPPSGLNDVLFAQEGLAPFIQCMGYKSLHAGSALKALTRTVCYNNQIHMTDALIRKLIRENRTPTTREEDRIKPMSRLGFAFSTEEGKQAHEQKIQDAGKKRVYSIDSEDLQFPLGSYEFAYASYLHALHKAAGN